MLTGKYAVEEASKIWGRVLEDRYHVWSLRDHVTKWASHPKLRMPDKLFYKCHMEAPQLVVMEVSLVTRVVSLF